MMCLQMSRDTLSYLLLIAVMLSLAAAAATLVPVNGKVVSDLGYYTLCPFAPYSTLTLLVIAGLAWIVRGYVERQEKPPSA